MAFSKISLFALASAAIALSGCTSSRFGDNNNNYPPAALPRPPASGSVTQQDLPPPGGYPNAPVTAAAATTPASSETQVASLEAPTNASDLTPASVAGVWNASVGGMNCRIVTPQTKYGQGYRAGALRCPAAFSDVGSWAIKGKQLNLYDSAGNSIASLYSSSPSHFEGRTTSGETVILSR